MASREELLARLDQAAQLKHFPLWGRDADYGFTGAMRVSGYVAGPSLAIVFESVELSVGLGDIQTIVRCFATFPIDGWIHPAPKVLVPYDTLIDPDTGQFALEFGTVHVDGRDHEFVVSTDAEELISGGYLESGASALTPEAVLYRICDAVPHDQLFCDPEYIKRSFAIDQLAQRLFAVEEWEHPGQEIYIADAKPTDYPDIVALADALATGDSSPKLSGKPNTLWRMQAAEE